MTAKELVPFRLSWAEVDPRPHPFDPASARTEVAALAPAARVPARPAESASDLSDTEGADDFGDAALAWTEEMTQALVERFGRWALGWRWAADEGDIGGGPVRSWCCATDSISGPEETLDRVAAALCEWRAWLEELPGHFDRFPLSGPPGPDTLRTRDRATTHLVAVVVERTEAADAWYEHCAQALGWYLAYWGVAQDTARAHARKAVGGRFHSWVEPTTEVVRDVAERLSVSSPSSEPG